MNCSYGFRPGRSAHQAIGALREGLMAMGGGYVIDLDIRKYFDTIDHGRIQEIVRQRVRDGVVLRLIGKWLNAGVMEESYITYPESGVPQGGVVSPILSNIYLHEVLDSWFEEVVKAHLYGKAFMVRFADDAVLVLARRDDAERVMAVLPKRFEKYGLKLHPEKTRLVSFKRPGDGGAMSADPGTFNFLGFTHFWSKSRRGYWVIKRKTARDRFSRSLKRLNQWIRRVRHQPIAEQHKVLCSKVRGHIQYYGITGNSVATSRYVYYVRRCWKKWLGRRSYASRRTWDWFNILSKRFPLPVPRMIHFC